MEPKAENQLSDAKRIVVEAFERVPFLERLRPVLAELGYQTMQSAGMPTTGHVPSDLPPWCKTVCGQLVKTIFKGVVEASPVKLPIWESLGVMCGCLFRACQFVQVGKDAELKEAGLDNLTEEERLRFAKLMGVSRWEEFTSMQALIPDTPENRLNRQDGVALPTKIRACAGELLGLAQSAKPEDTQQFLDRMGKGYKGCLDDQGQWVGITSRTNTYWHLLVFRPEIEVMRKARPCKTCHDLYEWLVTLMGRNMLGDEGSFQDLCEEIHLGMKPPGRPRKQE